MRWSRGHRSRNVEDRRHQSGGGGAGAASLLQLLFLVGRSRIGLIGIVVFLLFMWFTGVDPLALLSGGGVSSPSNTAARDAAGRLMLLPGEFGSDGVFGVRFRRVH